VRGGLRITDHSYRLGAEQKPPVPNSQALYIPLDVQPAAFRQGMRHPAHPAAEAYYFTVDSAPRAASRYEL
jgi:hypothetical protein